jgi:integrase
MRRHKASGQAICTIRLADGTRKDIYLGPWRSKAATQEYNRVIAELAAAGGSMPCPDATADVTVVELLTRYKRHVESHYRKPDGTPTSQVHSIRSALRFLRQLYGATPAREFGPLALKAVRGKMIADGLARPTVNAWVVLVRAFFKWAASEQLIPASVAVALSTVKGLERGRTKARETEPVRPPDPEHIDKALPFMPTPVATLVRLQLLTGARPGELVGLMAADIDRSSTPWMARPDDHKTAHRGRSREILFGPTARSILEPVIQEAGDGFLFSPAKWDRDRHAVRSENRTTPRYPSHLERNRRKRKKVRRRAPGACYSVDSYRRAITRACELAKVPTWGPHQLRHAAATHLRREFGIETARVILGHTSIGTTAIYAEADRQKAVQAVEKVG